MVSVSQIKNGISRYVDCEMLPGMAETGYKKVLFVTGISILLSRIDVALDKLKDNTILKALDIFDKDGNVDIDIIVKELRKNVPQSGLRVELPFIGELVFYESDIGIVHNYIIGG
jgi:hypothetical protein